MQKPFSQACVNNQRPIAQVLIPAFNDVSKVLEVGSGTGQHAVFLAPQMPHLQWQTSDLEIHHEGINAWLRESDCAQLLEPLTLDVDDVGALEFDQFDALFTANTLHIMSAASVSRFFETVVAGLAVGAVVCVYGPFNYNGKFTSPSNQNFDGWLKARDPMSGIRDYEWIQELAEKQGLRLIADHPMPANNRLLHWANASRV